jgi:hypothetical protein
VGDDLWSTSKTIEYVAAFNAPATGQEHVKVSVHPYSDKSKYIGTADSVIYLEELDIHVVPGVLESPDHWGTGWANLYVAVDGFGMTAPMQYTWIPSGLVWLADGHGTYHYSAYTTTERFTYPYLPYPTTDGAVYWVRCIVEVERADRTMADLGEARGLVGYSSKAAGCIFCGAAEGYQGVTTNNAWLELGRPGALQSPTSGAFLPDAGWILDGLHKGDRIVLRTHVKSVPAGETTAEAGHGPVYIWGGYPSTHVAKLCDALTVNFGSGGYLDQIFDVPAF